MKKAFAVHFSVLIYFLIPVDLVPDANLGIGKLNDIAVLRVVLKFIGSDLDGYRQ